MFEAVPGAVATVSSAVAVAAVSSCVWGRAIAAVWVATGWLGEKVSVSVGCTQMGSINKEIIGFKWHVEWWLKRMMGL